MVLKYKNQILIFSLLFEILYLFLFIFSFGRIFFEDNSYPPLRQLAATLFSLWLVVAGSIYFAFFFVLRHNQGLLKKEFKLVLIFICFFTLTLFLAWPVGSADIFTYVYKSRIFTLYGQNPYQFSTSYFCQDAASALIACTSEPMTYGPLWVFLSFLASLVSLNQIILNVYLLKLLAIIFYFISIFLVYKILSLILPQEKFFATTLYAYNPLLLFEIANNGHNDIIMVSLVLLALYFYFKDKKLLVIPVLILSCLVKYVTIIFLPVFYLFLIKKLKSNKEKIRFTLETLVLSLFLIVIFYLPLWQGLATFLGVSSFVSDNWLYHISLVPTLLFVALWLIKNLKFVTLGFYDTILVVKLISLLLFFIFYFYQLVVIKNKKITKVLLATLFLFLLFTVKIHSWYFVWLAPFLVFLPLKRKPWLLLVMTLVFMLDYFFYFFLSSLIIFFSALTIFILNKQLKFLPPPTDGYFT